jgi:serine phosphatase RsbU (regulator of sigma subunit)
VYRRKTKQIEKIVAGGLALGVRTITNKNSISAKELALDDGDILFGYTDGLVEVRDIATNALLGVDGLKTLL